MPRAAAEGEAEEEGEEGEAAEDPPRDRACRGGGRASSRISSPELGGEVLMSPTWLGLEFGVGLRLWLRLGLGVRVRFRVRVRVRC